MLLSHEMCEQLSWEEPCFLFLMSSNANETLFSLFKHTFVILDEPVAWILKIKKKLKNGIKTLGECDKITSSIFFPLLLKNHHDL